jgi:hydroxylamine dehydrogenase
MEKKLIKLSFLILLSISMTLMFSMTGWADLTKESEKCLSCHKEATSFAVKEWERSKHFKNGVSCFECHGSDAANPAAYKHMGFTISTLVTPKQCYRCHPGVVEEYQNSIHAKSGLIAQGASALGGGSYWNIAASVLGWIPWDFHKGLVKEVGQVVTYGEKPIMYKGKEIVDWYWNDLKKNPALEWGTWPVGCDRANKSTKDVIQIFADWGCLWCHGSTVKIKEKTETSVKFYAETYPTGGAGRVNPDGTFGNCAACHPAHSFDLAIARSPHACGRCHESEDHPNFEAYIRSMHGAIYYSTMYKSNYEKSNAKPGVDYSSPTCALCHMGAVFQGDKKLYAPSHDVASICMWKFGAWQKTFIREKGMFHPAVKKVWLKIDPNYGVRFEKEGTPGAKEIDITYPSNGLDDRKKAMAVCNQCHSKQWTGNFFLTADSTIYMLSHIRDMAFDIGEQLKKAGVYKPLDQIMIRNIGAMGVRPTQIMMYHTAPGEVWWDGFMRVSQEFADWVETSVAPRLGTEEASKYISWVKGYEKNLDEIKGKKR